MVWLKVLTVSTDFRERTELLTLTCPSDDTSCLPTSVSFDVDLLCTIVKYQLIAVEREGIEIDVLTRERAGEMIGLVAGRGYVLIGEFR